MSHSPEPDETNGSSIADAFFKANGIDPRPYQEAEELPVSVMPEFLKHNSTPEAQEAARKSINDMLINGRSEQFPEGYPGHEP